MTVLAPARPVALAVPARRRRPLRALSWVAVSVIVIAAFWSADITWSRLGELPAEIVRYLGLMFLSPNWAKLPEALWQTWRSVEMAWIGTVLGILIATPLSLIAARGFGPAPVRVALRFVFSLVRAVPELVFAIIILSVTLGKWGYEAVENVAPGPIEAARAAGGSTAQVLRWGVWPQAAPTFFSFWLYRFEINVRASAVLGLIGVGGIGDMLTSYTQYREWSTVGMLLIVVVRSIPTVAIDAVSGRIRRRIMEGPRVR